MKTISKGSLHWGGRVGGGQEAVQERSQDDPGRVLRGDQPGRVQSLGTGEVRSKGGAGRNRASNS